MRTYLPATRDRDHVSEVPGSMFFVSAMRPGWVAVAGRVGSSGILSCGVSVRRTTSWWITVPAFLIAKVTLPVGADDRSSLIALSRSVTAMRPVGAGATATGVETGAGTAGAVVRAAAG